MGLQFRLRLLNRLFLSGRSYLLHRLRRSDRVSLFPRLRLLALLLRLILLRPMLRSDLPRR